MPIDSPNPRHADDRPIAPLSGESTAPPTLEPPPVTPTPGGVRRSSVPPESFDPLRALGSLLLVVAVALPALVVALNRPDVHDRREARTLLRSRETWQRLHDGDASALLIPTRGSIESLDQGPVIVWLHVAAWAGLDPATATADQLTFRARLASALCALTALIATYWAAVCIGGVRTARMSALALGTTILFAYLSRLATPDAAGAAAVTLAAAAGMWAARPLKQISGMSRRILGWPIAGLCLGVAILTIGAPAVPLVLTPILAAILMTPKRRIDNLFGLLFALLLGLLASMPWHLYAIGRVDGAWQQFVDGSFTFGEGPVHPWNFWQWAMLLAPWQVWLIAGLLQPFLRAASEARRQLLIAWIWLGALAAMMIGAADDRFILALLPAAAIIIGQLWSYHAQLASERIQDPGVDLLRIPHWLLIIAMSIAGPAFVALQPWLVETGRLERIELPGLAWPGAVGLGIALLGIALLGTRWHWKWRPRLAAYATSFWMAVALTVGLASHASSTHERYRLRETALGLSAFAGDRPLYYVMQDSGDPGPEPPFLFYLHRNLRAVPPDRIAQLVVDQPDALFILRVNASESEFARVLGLAPMQWPGFATGRTGTHHLYRVAKPAAEANP